MCATWVPQIIGAVPGIQHGESRVTTDGKYSPNVAMSNTIDITRVFSILLLNMLIKWLLRQAIDNLTILLLIAYYLYTVL